MSNCDISLKKLIIFGTGDFGQVAYYYLKNDSPYEIVAFTANKWTIKENSLFEIPIIPFEEIEKIYNPKEHLMFIAIPYTKMNTIRAEIFFEAKKKGFELISYVNSKAIISKDFEMGENCFILENNVIQPFVKIGDNVIIWSGNHIGHHSQISNHCFISSHVVISGKVTIGPYCFLGVNSTIRNGIHISKKSMIGAGCLILNDTVEGGTYKSSEAKLLPVKSDDVKNV